MTDERERFNEKIAGKKKISVDYDEMVSFVSKRTEFIKFKGIPFETSRRSRSISGTQGKGSNPVFVTNGQEYILISEPDFKMATRNSSNTDYA
jgi:hypothetical protein